MNIKQVAKKIAEQLDKAPSISESGEQTCGGVDIQIVAEIIAAEMKEAMKKHESEVLILRRGLIAISQGQWGSAVRSVEEYAQAALAAASSDDDAKAN